MVSVKCLVVAGAAFLSLIVHASNNKHVTSKELIRDGRCNNVHRHGHWSGQGGFVTLINATPYDWNLTSLHPNHMEYDFPGFIPAGKMLLSTLPGSVTVLTQKQELLTSNASTLQRITRTALLRQRIT
jgi:hypothetical protein